MSISDPLRLAARRLLLPAAVLLLAGCHSARQPTAVVAPPPPSLGSGPIAAYDAYALAIQPHVGTPRSAHSILVSSR